jgi:methylmalonyl-CoA mutase
MAAATESGLPKLRIEEAAARRQAKIDSGSETIVGVNKHRLAKEDPIEILDVDNVEVRRQQIARLEKLKAERDNEAVKAALHNLSECARTGNGNLLELAVEAAKVRASLGEISDALEAHWGRHKAEIKMVSGVYSSEYAKSDEVNEVRAMTEAFAKAEGRRPRILVAKLGQDGHDRGAKVVATAYADLGFDVDMGPLFQTPDEAARMGVENDVHIIAMSSLAAGHKTLLPTLVGELKKLGREDIMVVAGGVIPAQDYDALRQAGAAAIFGPGTNIPHSAKVVLTELDRRLGLELFK